MTLTRWRLGIAVLAAAAFMACGGSEENGTSGTSGTGGTNTAGAGGAGQAGTGGSGLGGANGGQGAQAGQNPGGAGGSSGGAAGDAGAGGSGQAGQNAGGSSGQAGSGGQGQGGSSPQSFDLRIMAANLTSGNAQSYDPGHGARIMKAMKPDIVLIQEFNYGSNSDSDIRKFVTETFGQSFHYFREQKGSIRNGIISRYPIMSSGSWNDSQVSNRNFAWATIDLPGPRDLLAISVHFLTKNSGVRSAEGKQLAGYLDGLESAGKLPYYVVVGGDFNSVSRSENWVKELSHHFVTAGPYPVDNEGNGNTNRNRNKPYDWVLANRALDGHKVTLHIGSHDFPHGLVFDSRVYTPLSEVPPVQPDDSAARNMQHMGVIRQFHVSY